jgi:hypothetical protein
MDDQFIKSLRDTQETDQMLAATKLCAKLMWSYNQALREEGFGLIEALQLTLAYQTSLMAMNQNNQNGGKP